MGATHLKDGKSFEAEVASLFRFAGYSVQLNVQYSGQEFDVIATKREFGELQIRIAVECKDRSKTIGNSLVQDFVNAFSATAREHGLTYGLVVSNRGFSRNAHEAIRAHPQIRLIQYNELEHELLGGRAYLEAAKRNYRSDFKKYISLAATQIGDRQKAKVNIPDIALHCAARLSSDSPTLTVLLGDFGSGKTTIAEHVHSYLSNSFLEDGTLVFPVILYLRILEQHDSDENFIEAHLKLGSQDFTLDRLNGITQRRRLAFILDGFDEVAANASEDERMRLFSRVMKVGARAHAVMLTSRPSYFNNIDELNGLVDTIVSRDVAAVHGLKGQALRRDHDVQRELNRHQDLMLQKLGAGSFPTFARGATAMFVVNPLEREDIIRFLTPHAGTIKRYHRKTPDQVYDFLMGVYDLTDLLTRPLLLDMFVDLLINRLLDLSQPDMELGPAAIYHLYVNYHLQRDWKTKRFLNPVERLAFARASAVAMLAAGGNLEASYDSVWKIVRDAREVITPERWKVLENNREGVVTDVRVCSFMNVTPANRIEFSHKSFMEFFVAEVVAMRLSAMKPIDILEHPLSYEILYFLGSYALIRSEVRLEIIQHLTHVGYRMDTTYRSNLLVALIFSERKSTKRNFRELNYSGVRISRKKFVECTFDSVSLRRSLLIDSDFELCSFEDVVIEGEVKKLSLNQCQGNIGLPSNCEALSIQACRQITIRSTTGGISAVHGATWRSSNVDLLDGLKLVSGALDAVTIFLGPKTRIIFDDCKLNTIAIAALYAKAARDLPFLAMPTNKIAGATLLFVKISLEDYIDQQQNIESCRGVIVIDDPERTLLRFRRKDEGGVERYVSYFVTAELIIVSSEAYDRIDRKTLENMTSKFRKFRWAEWRVHEGRDPLLKIIKDAKLEESLAEQAPQ
jgi:hypothetical protein